MQALTRVATPADERAFAITALDVDANAVQAICDEYRWARTPETTGHKRDGGCTFPVCSSTRNLDIHHVDGWTFGGETSVATGATLCRSCDTTVHG